ncbi:conserved hypothetical protein [Enterobacterales bacterium 8AC]|nr:conserved hypothetical protein [Enterobacterales bacterium 8AC]
MYRFNDTFDAFMSTYARAPYYAIACHQRAQGAADVAAMQGAIRCFNVGMHTETADDDPILWFAQLGIVQLWFIVSALKTALMVRLHAALLTFGQFVLTHCASLESAFIAQDEQKGYDTHYFILNNRC